MSALTCPRCAGDIEYEVESTDSGDGVWAQSGYVGLVSFTALVLDEASGKVRVVDANEPGAPDYTHGMTTCWCVWKADEIEWLHDRATEAIEPVTA